MLTYTSVGRPVKATASACWIPFFSPPFSLLFLTSESDVLVWSFPGAFTFDFRSSTITLFLICWPDFPFSELRFSLERRGPGVTLAKFVDTAEVLRTCLTETILLVTINNRKLVDIKIPLCCELPTRQRLNDREGAWERISLHSSNIVHIQNLLALVIFESTEENLPGNPHWGSPELQLILKFWVAAVASEHSRETVIRRLGKTGKSLQRKSFQLHVG